MTLTPIHPPSTHLLTSLDAVRDFVRQFFN